MFFWDDEGPQRRAFSIKTKRVEWLKAAGDSANKVLIKYLADGKVPTRMPRSRCRGCKRPLTWGSGTYDFDHFNNRSYDSSQKNCRLVCKNCHGGATKIKVIRQYNRYTGELGGHRTIKLKVGIKKPAKKSAKKAVKKPTRKAVKKPASKTGRRRR